MEKEQAIEIIKQALNVSVGSNLFKNPRDVSLIYQALDLVLSPEKDTEAQMEEDTSTEVLVSKAPKEKNKK